MKNTFTTTENISAADRHAANVIYVVKICLFTLIALLIFVLKGTCSDSTHITAKNIVYVQLSGAGNSHSINFERVFSQGRTFNYSYSIGYSPAKKSVSIPISLNAFTTGSKHHFEMSLAVITHVEQHLYEKVKTDLDKQLYIKPSIGYRYQQSTGGLFIRAGVGPQIFMDPPSYNVWDFTPKVIGLSGQVAVGFSF